MSRPAYRLVRRAAPPPAPPRLDEQQRRVVAHPGGPLLLLAGPGTGKTTTIVEAVVDRIERRGLPPERVLVLTFSRKAAHELRERITARLRRTTRQPLALTFHSYAYALVRRELLALDDAPPRLLSGPEQLMEIRELLRGEVQDGAADWPPALRPAMETRGFAEELRDFGARATERGLGPEDVSALGARLGRPDWVAVGRFLRRAGDRFDIAPVPAFDYAELVRVAVNLLADPQVRLRVRAEHDAVFVDEYQDTDPAQEELLRALAGDGGDLVAVGDPDQSIYGFRGADVRGILEFPDRFRTADGNPAPVVALRTCRRFGPQLLAASRSVAQRLPAAPSPDGSRVNQHRELDAPPGADPGSARVLRAESATQEAALIADTLRRAHLVDGRPWSRMAVVVRSAVRQVPVLRRALLAAGVPVTVSGDELPLGAEPVVRPLLNLMRYGLRPGLLDGARAEELLTSPLGGADAVGLRRLGRALRELDRAEGGRRPTSALLVAALRRPEELTLVADRVGAPARRVGGLLALVGERAAQGRSAEEVLWELWSASGLADELLARSQSGGARGAAADRDLDAVVALFETAARYVDRLPPGSPEGFLDDIEAQEIPADTLAEQAPAGDAVRLLTAHRSKGLEWDLVIVAGVQEGVWPDLRLRGSLLGVERLVDAAAGRFDGTGAALVSRLLDEERRLFYVAVTRARHELVVTAVGGEDTEERPSRFLTELGLGEPEPVSTGRRWLALPALVGDLRSVVADTGRDLALRRAAAAHLARLARAGVRGADPGEWYALTPLSDPSPVVAPDESITVSPSQVEQFTSCGLRWLLEAAVGARAAESVQHLGSVVHALAVLAAEGADEAALGRRLDEIWSQLDFGSRWYNARQRDRAETMVRRFLDWHRENPRKLTAVEEPFDIRVGRIRITGRVDRLETDDSGRGIVVDIKTGSARPGEAELSRHPQLGAYQLATMLAAFERHGLTEAGGAELVQVGDAGFRARARVQRQPAVTDDAEPHWPLRLVETVADGMSGSVFEARRGDGCRTCPVRSCCPAHDEGAHVGEAPPEGEGQGGPAGRTP
ncbi:ATP-dependent helicase [Allonocardiopsis opalescens]|uniref:DNA 3'-5' helicase n=1 Tax=Allonocardiopsis opalescens TaxID=1144618 RepID=A0A2T0QDK4_9ACTN|nr:ATP-dependent DNA helicase [Allonocardiopsis opalescens]PRY01995.1 superfamily I DNA/RNA helicase [Allonocardiopsis opalescens]